MELSETYEVVERYSNDICLVKNKQGQIALINISTKENIIPFGSYTYEVNQEQLYFQCTDGKKGYCDILKGIILPPTFTNIEIQICKRASNNYNDTIDYIIYYFYYMNEEGIEVCDILYFEDENVDSKIQPIDENDEFLQKHQFKKHQIGSLKTLALGCYGIKKINDKYKLYMDQNGQMYILSYVEPEYHQQYHNSGNLITRRLDATRIISPTDLKEIQSDNTKYRNILILLKEHNGETTYGIYWGREIYSHKEEFLIPPEYKNITIEQNSDSGAYIFICEKQNGKFDLKIEYYDSQQNLNKTNDLTGEYDSITYIENYIILISGTKIEVYDINKRTFKEVSQDPTNSSIIFIKVDNKYHIYDIDAKKRVAIINFKSNYELLDFEQGDSVIKITSETITGTRITLYDLTTKKEISFFPVSSFKILTIDNKTVIEVSTKEGIVFKYEPGQENEKTKQTGRKSYSKKRIKLNKDRFKGKYFVKTQK